MGLFGNFFGGGAKINYQPPQNIQNFMQPVPVTDMQKTDFYGRLLNDKQGYDTAQKSIDLIQQALQTPELSEASRNNWRRKMQGYEDARDAYAQDANSVRQSAASLGLDVSDYDTNKSLQESAQAFQNYKTNAVKDFLNLPSMADLEENRYMELRSQGASPGQANRILNRERGKMRDQLTRRYKDAFLTYGKNSDGSVDPTIGMHLLEGLAEVNPQAAQMYSTGFALPQKVYDANQNMALTLLQNDEAMKRLIAQNDFNWQNSEAQRAATLWNANEDRKHKTASLEYTIKNQREESALERESRENIEKAKLLVRLSSGNGGGKGDKSLQSEIEELAMNLGWREDLPDEDKRKIEIAARDTVLEKHYPGWRGKPNEQFKKAADTYNTIIELGYPDSVARRAAAQVIGAKELESKSDGIFNSFDTMLSLIESGDEDTAGAMLQKIDTGAEEDPEKFNAKFDAISKEERAGQIKKYNDLRAAFKEYLDLDPKKLGKDNMQDALLRLKAKYKAAQIGGDWFQIYSDWKLPNVYARRRQEKEQPPEDKISQADKIVKDLLGGKPIDEQTGTKNNGANIPLWEAHPSPDNFFGIRYYTNR